MSKITPAEFTDYIKKVHEHLEWSPPPPDRLRFLALALCGEAGELANLVKKDWRGDDGQVVRQAKIAQELADVAGYAFLIAAELGVDLLWETYQKVQEAETRPAFLAFKNKGSHQPTGKAQVF